MTRINLTRKLTIDIGTNSTLWLLSDVEDGILRIVERGIELNRLGSDSHDDGSLPHSLIESNREILDRIVRKGKSLGANLCQAVGTEALRKAPNRSEFVKMAAEVGVQLEIVDGKREAMLAWKGVFGLQRFEGKRCLLDVGGGSSELTVGDASGPVWSASVPIGAVRLTKHFRNDPLTESEVAEACASSRAASVEWVGRVEPEARLIGIAGTVTTLASLELEAAEYRSGMFDGFVLTLSRIDYWRERLLAMSLAEREKLRGMPSGRAAIIPAGAIILAEVMRLIGRESLEVSERGVMFGLALEG